MCRSRACSAQMFLRCWLDLMISKFNTVVSYWSYNHAVAAERFEDNHTSLWRTGKIDPSLCQNPQPINQTLYRVAQIKYPRSKFAISWQQHKILRRISRHSFSTSQSINPQKHVLISLKTLIRSLPKFKALFSNFTVFLLFHYKSLFRAP